MGNVMASSSSANTSVAKVDHTKGPTFDPKFGFPNGRKKRVMIATQEEMESAKLDMDRRDYCAHHLITYQTCRANMWPFPYKCAHEKHTYLQCEYEDYILRMKEFEREKRLLQRKNRIEARGGCECKNM